ncbi:uridine kinase family protein [Prochlorococcus marinus]|uniref:uridine kinase family protein n=1 Tax=Prochlorococcus marinus TaxID=1219 RepID=UPI0022B5BE0C|nr:uridine kinase [Prochlorococcus marinus]
MRTIVITGASGSGKSYLTNKLSKLFYNSIIIKTDSYYRDNILIRLLSIFIYDIYDRPLSIKKFELNKTLRSIYKKQRLITHYKYDFKSKLSSKSQIKINYKEDNQLLILEGIFAHRLSLNYTETINIVCEEEKDICYKRRLTRDKLERGRDSSDVYKKFNKSWYLYYLNVKKFLKNNKVLWINPREEISYDKLVVHIKNL